MLNEMTVAGWMKRQRVEG